MSNRVLTGRMKERVDKCTSYVKARPNQELVIKEMMDLTGACRNTIHNYMPIIEKTLGGRISTNASNRFVWTPEIKEDTPFKNSEGYFDPTAGKAIANLENVGTKIMQRTGDIWEYKTSIGSVGKFLVLSVWND